jgi:hypothetical protein
VIPNATVTLVDEQTALTRKTTTNGAGTYSFVNLPIGSYTVTYEATGFETQKTPHITVQGNRTATLNAQLKVAAAAGQTIEVDATPLMNAVDTTNGYVMDKAQIEACRWRRAALPAWHAIPGVKRRALRRHRRQFRPGQRAHLGQRPARHVNIFLLNGVDASNLFNGKSTSQVPSARVINSTGVSDQPGGRRRDSLGAPSISPSAMPFPRLRPRPFPKSASTRRCMTRSRAPPPARTST